MALTDEELEQIISEVLARIKAAAQPVEDLEEVSSLDGVDSLPALRGSTLVRVPLSLVGNVTFSDPEVTFFEYPDMDAEGGTVTPSYAFRQTYTKGDGTTGEITGGTEG